MFRLYRILYSLYRILEMTIDGEVYRKIQVTGGSTYIVSLPKSWVERNGLDRGSSVLMRVEGDRIVITPHMGGRHEKTADIDATDMDLKFLERMVLSHYLSGADIIRIRARPLREEYKAVIRKVIKKKMIGFEVFDEGLTYIEIRSLVREGELSMEMAMRRMFKIGRVILSTLPEVVMTLDRADARSIIQHDDEMDRFYLYTLRTIRREYGEVWDAGRIIITAMLSKTLERIVDHGVRIAYTVLSMKDPIEGEVKNDVYSLINTANELYTSVEKAYLNMNINLANQVITNVKKVIPDFTLVANKIDVLDIPTIKTIQVSTILDSIKRICEYVADIGEMIIDLNTTFST